MKPMTEDQANAVYDVLVQYAGAPESWRYNFVYHQMHSVCYEYRFQGDLGFGGKFRRDYWTRTGERWYVDQYIEDETPVSKGIVEKTNAHLALLAP